MDQKPEVIRQRIEETRCALSDKIETLEREVRGTVREAREAVTGSVDNVRDTVSGVRETVKATVDDVRDKLHETACSIQEAFNLERQVEAHPWAMFGGSVAAGYLLGSVLPDAVSSARSHLQETASLSSFREPSRFTQEERSAPAKPREPGILDGLLAQFGPELQKAKGLAIGTAIGLARDLLKRQLPKQLANDFDKIVDSVTTKLGGEPVAGPVISGLAEDNSTCARSGRETPVGSGRGNSWREGAGERRFDY